MRESPGLTHSRTVTSLVASIVLFASALLANAQQPQQAQPAQQGPLIIRSIDVEYTGPATVSKERILAQLRTAVGKPYSEAVVEQDVRQLYSTGAIRNVR